jgi:predicted ATPase
VLKPFHTSAAALQGALLIGREDSEQGISMLHTAVQNMQGERLNVIKTLAACWLADGLTAAGRADEALTVIRNARRDAVRGTEAVLLPELLRLQSRALLSISQTNDARAERLLLRSCRIAHHQSAPGWELRSALDLSRLQAQQGDCDQARSLLATIYDRFTEGFATNDLQLAARLLRDLDPAQLTARVV